MSDPLSRAPTHRLHTRALAAGWHLLDPELAAGLPIDGAGASPGTLLAGSLDEPVVLTRDAAGVSRLLSNACPHRGARVVDGAGASRTLRCPYHGRRFGLDGRCTAAPGFGDLPGFPADDDHLPVLPSGHLGAVPLAGLHPVRPLARALRPLLDRVGWLPLHALAPVPELHRDYEVAAHWVIYVENYLEGLHVPFVHAGLNASLSLPEYAVEIFDGGSLQLGVAAPGGPAFTPPPGHPDAGRAIHAWYFHLSPATMINVYPWGISANAVQPVGLDRVRVRFTTWTWEPPGSAAFEGIGRQVSALHQTELEDERVVQSVQRAHRAHAWRGGRLHPRHEAAVRAFRAELARYGKSEGLSGA